MKAMIKSFTERYRVSEWRIEKNAYQASIIQDQELRTWLHGRGSMMEGHFTDARKWDSDFGVSSMATLFDGWRDGRNLIRLPSTYNSEGMKALVEQLTGWFPETKAKTDTVMALWFAEIRCRELMFSEFDGWHLGVSEFTSDRDRHGQMVVDVDLMLQQQGSAAMSWDGSQVWKGGF